MSQPFSLTSAFGKRLALCMVGSLAPLFAIAVNCTSSDEQPAPSDETMPAEASTEATAMIQQEAGSITHPEASTGAMDTGHVTSPDKDGGAPAVDGGSGGKDAGRQDAAAASDACAAYCACYEKKCSVFVPIPNGQDCPAFCSTFENNKTRYDCRFNMCFYNSAGPAQNNNNHCQHTVGIDECL